MHQCEQRVPVRKLRRDIGQDSQRQAVQHDRLAVRHLQQTAIARQTGSPRPAREIPRRYREHSTSQPNSRSSAMIRRSYA